MKPGFMRWLVLASLLLVLVIITASAYIRLSQAGLGCADWPACYGRDIPATSAGQLIPEQSPLFWARALHRVAASLAGLLVALIVFVGWERLASAGARVAAVATLVLAGFLAWLGRITPTELPAVTLGNQLGGMSLMALLWWLYLRGRGPADGADRTHCWVALAALALQFALGGLIGARHAVLACTSLPDCNGHWWPTSPGWRLFNPFFVASVSELNSAALETLVLAHRFGALLVVAILFVLGLRAVRRARAALGGWLLLGILGLQLTAGAGMVLADYPLPVATMHNLFAALLLGVTINLLWQASERDSMLPTELSTDEE